jgi:hypothetical protein
MDFRLGTIMQLNTNLGVVALGASAFAGVAGGVGVTMLEGVSQRHQTARAKAEYAAAKQYIADANANFNATAHGSGDHAKWLVEHPPVPGVSFEMGDNQVEGQGKAYLALQNHSVANFLGVAGGILGGMFGVGFGVAALRGTYTKPQEVAAFAGAGLGAALFAGGLYEAFSNPDQGAIVQQIDPGSNVPQS